MAKPKTRALFQLESFESRQLLSASTADTSATPTAPVEPDVVGTVFLDRNSDAVRAASERGLRGFTVDLVDSSGATVQTVRSDRAGRFRFGGLTEGATYTVKVEAREGFTATTDTSVPVTIAADSIARVAVGEVRDATSTTPSTDDGTTPTIPVKPNIVGTVYLDRNADTVRGKSEHGLRGFTVTLTDSAGATVGTTTTDRIGRYRFSDIADGTYIVTVTAKDGFTASGAQTATVTVASGTVGRAAFGETRTATVTTTRSGTESSIGTTGDAAPNDSTTPPPARGHGRRQGRPPADDSAVGDTSSTAATAIAAVASTDAINVGSTNDAADPAKCPPPPFADTTDSTRQQFSSRGLF